MSWWAALIVGVVIPVVTYALGVAIGYRTGHRQGTKGGRRRDLDASAELLRLIAHELPDDALPAFRDALQAVRDQARAELGQGAT